MNTKEELITILKIHASKYPQMQPKDAVKLLYQNEFGGGHLITDAKMCLERIRREYASFEYPDEPVMSRKQQLPDESMALKESSSCGEISLYEDIGNGMVRVNLAAISHESSLDELCAAFIKSAAVHQGNMENFKMKLRILSDEYTQCGFSFCRQELEDYLEQYAKAGYPMVSHSERYKEIYHPAYRIVCESFVDKKW